MSKNEFITELLNQPNTFSDVMITKLEAMLSLLDDDLLEKLYFEVFSDADNINKFKNSVMNMQYFYYYYKKFNYKMISKTLAKEFRKIIAGKESDFLSQQKIKELELGKCFDRDIDIKEALLKNIVKYYQNY